MREIPFLNPGEPEGRDITGIEYDPACGDWVVSINGECRHFCKTVTQAAEALLGELVEALKGEERAAREALKKQENEMDALRFRVLLAQTRLAENGVEEEA